MPRASRGNLADPSPALYLSHLGLPVVEVDDFAEVEFPGGKVTSTPFLGMECAGAPLTWLYGALLTQPVTKKMSDSRTLSGSNAEQAAAIMTELGAKEALHLRYGRRNMARRTRHGDLLQPTTPTNSSRSTSS